MLLFLLRRDCTPIAMPLRKSKIGTQVWRTIYGSPSCCSPPGRGYSFPHFPTLLIRLISSCAKNDEGRSQSQTRTWSLARGSSCSKQKAAARKRGGFVAVAEIFDLGLRSTTAGTESATCGQLFAAPDSSLRAGRSLFGFARPAP